MLIVIVACWRKRIVANSNSIFYALLRNSFHRTMYVFDLSIYYLHFECHWKLKIKEDKFLPSIKFYAFAMMALKELAQDIFSSLHSQLHHGVLCHKEESGAGRQSTFDWDHILLCPSVSSVALMVGVQHQHCTINTVPSSNYRTNVLGLGGIAEEQVSGVASCREWASSEGGREHLELEHQQQGDAAINDQQHGTFTSFWWMNQLSSIILSSDQQHQHIMRRRQSTVGAIC